MKRSVLLSASFAFLMLQTACNKSNWFCSCTFTERAFILEFENEIGAIYNRVREAEAEADCAEFTADTRAEHPDAVCTLEEL